MVVTALVPIALKNQYIISFFFHFFLFSFLSFFISFFIHFFLFSFHSFFISFFFHFFLSFIYPFILSFFLHGVTLSSFRKHSDIQSNVQNFSNQNQYSNGKGTSKIASSKMFLSNIILYQVVLYQAIEYKLDFQA